MFGFAPVTFGMGFDINIFIKAAAEDKHGVQEDDAQSQGNHNKDRPALIALKVGLRHARNKLFGICLFSALWKPYSVLT